MNSGGQSSTRSGLPLVLQREDAQGFNVAQGPAAARRGGVASYPNTAQSCGEESGGPGLMSFQKVKLPSAPSLYSSLPPFGLLAWNHSALLNVDSGVESGSFTGALTGTGAKSVPMLVHCVTLPSAPNLNS